MNISEEKKYRQAEGLNYSKLAAFHESPDHALLSSQPKSYFEFGRAFELFICDRIKGTSFFHDRFFVFNHKSKMPEKLAGWIENGENLKKKYNLNQDGSRSKTSKTAHAWLDACIDHPGRMPMSQYEFDCLCIMTHNMLNMPIKVGREEYLVSEVLSATDFQYPLYWEEDGVKKKALFDNFLKVNETVFSYDIKTTEDFSRFRRMIRTRYWIQDIHYTRGGNTLGFAKPMVFLVASKADPFLAKSFVIDEQGRHDADMEYELLCMEYLKWKNNGSPQVGWKPQEEIKLYFNGG